MATASLVDATIKGFPNPSLPNHTVNPDYAAIKELHQLLMDNASSFDSNLGVGQNGYLGLVLPPKQYALIVDTPFVRPPNLGRTAVIPLLTLPR